MENNIINLHETSANIWQAKYRGNYGIYNIKIKMKAGLPDRQGSKIDSYSCSCPSDASPCKHIAVIMDAISNRIAENNPAKQDKENAITVEDVLRNVPHKELIDFMLRQAKYNPELTNTILLEFLHKSAVKQENNYTMVLRKALKKIHFDYDDLYEYHESAIEIDILDEWFAKAKEYIFQKRFDEAIAICKACIEEYTEWMKEVEDDIIEYIDPVYQEKPFELIKEIASNPAINANELFHYCITEMCKTKYTGACMYDGFNDLLMELARTENNAVEFIALQDKLLQNITDKSSFEAQKIIERKMVFYKKNNQSETAWQLVSDNIQIESFRKQVVEQKIADNKFAEAKKLIADFLSTRPGENLHYNREWYALVLSIAQNEKDTPVIRKISFAFIENYFQAEYYRIYKSSFNPNEWEDELQNIIDHYEKNGKFFSDSVADVLAEEKDAFRLMTYIEKYLSAERMDHYHCYFARVHPKETLDLFRKAINQYAGKNTGRNYYEYMVSLFKKIVRIEGGKEMATTMIAQYKVQYKNRRAMVEIFSKVKL